MASGGFRETRGYDQYGGDLYYIVVEKDARGWSNDFKDSLKGFAINKGCKSMVQRDGKHFFLKNPPAIFSLAVKEDAACNLLQIYSNETDRGRAITPTGKWTPAINQDVKEFDVMKVRVEKGTVDEAMINMIASFVDSRSPSGAEKLVFSLGYIEHYGFNFYIKAIPRTGVSISPVNGFTLYQK